MNLKFSVLVFLVFLVFLGHDSIFAQSKPLFPVLKTNSLADTTRRAGFIDRNGKLAIDFNFYYASKFSEGLAAVMVEKGKKWGYISEDGLMAIDPQFDEAGPFTNGIARVKVNKRAFFITRDGTKALETSFVLLGFLDGVSPAKSNGKWGVIDSKGSIIVPFMFQTVNPFYEGLSAVTQADKIGYISKDGDWAIPPRFSKMLNDTDALFLPNFSECLAVFRDNDYFGYIDKKGQVIIPATFERADPFSEGLAVVKQKGKIGYVNKSGRFEIEATYNSGRRFSEGLAAVEVEGKWGFIDRQGNLKILPRYDSVDVFKDGLAETTIYDRKRQVTVRGYINQEGQTVFSWYY